jgi:hypothetical protein
MSNEFSERFATINDLSAVHGGDGDAAVCAEQVGTAGALGAIAGATRGGGLPGAAIWGGTSALGTYLNSPACGDGTKSPLTLGREWMQNKINEMPGDNGGLDGVQWNALGA